MTTPNPKLLSHTCKLNWSLISQLPPSLRTERLHKELLYPQRVQHNFSSVSGAGPSHGSEKHRNLFKDVEKKKENVFLGLRNTPQNQTSGFL